MVGLDDADHLTHVLRGEPPPGPYTRFLNASALAGARIGVMRSISDVPSADPEVSAIFERALGDLKRQGASQAKAYRTPTPYNLVCKSVQKTVYVCVSWCFVVVTSSPLQE